MGVVILHVALSGGFPARSAVVSNSLRHDVARVVGRAVVLCYLRLLHPSAMGKTKGPAIILIVLTFLNSGSGGCTGFILHTLLCFA